MSEDIESIRYHISTREKYLNCNIPSQLNDAGQQWAIECFTERHIHSPSISKISYRYQNILRVCNDVNTYYPTRSNTSCV